MVLLAVACSWALGASAQWQWVDKDGRKVFSDRPPAQDVPPQNILKQPGGAPRPSTATAPAAPTAPAASAVGAPQAALPRPSGKDGELEARKAEAEAAEAARKKAEGDRIARARAENCTRAQQTKATLNSGQLLAHTNAQGERGFMSDATREAENKRADAIIASDCGAARSAP